MLLLVLVPVVVDPVVELVNVSVTLLVVRVRLVLVIDVLLVLVKAVVLVRLVLVALPVVEVTCKSKHLRRTRAVFFSDVRIDPTLQVTGLSLSSGIHPKQRTMRSMAAPWYQKNRPKNRSTWWRVDQPKARRSVGLRFQLFGQWWWLQ